MLLHHTLQEALLYPLTPLLRYLLDFLYKLFLHSHEAVGKILTGTSRRAVRL